MKSIGITRKLDDLGRITLPVEIRRCFELAHNTPIEIFVDADRIILQKYSYHCSLCGEEYEKNKLKGYKAALLCKKCLLEIKRLEASL